MTMKPESLLQKLRNYGREHGLPADRMFLLYVQQGFLARLSLSEYQEDFVLKGGLSLFMRYQKTARPTRDRRLSNHEEAVLEAMKAIVSIPLDDLLEFDPSEITTSRITEAAEYPGIRVMLLARLGKSKEKLQLDLSFGNAITPDPEVLEFPQIVLPQAISLKVYPLATVISEKFAAMVEIGETTSRMKDFYDLHAIFTQETLELTTLQQAIDRSFEHRNTPREDVEKVLGEVFLNSPVLATAWTRYLNTSGLTAPKRFREVMALIQRAMARVFQVEETASWMPGSSNWE